MNLKTLVAAMISFLFAVLIIGCGGGGGGSNTPPGTTGSGLTGGCSVGTANGTVNYTTLWGASSNSASQVIQVLDGAGNVIASNSVNRSSAVSSNIQMPNIVAGIYEVRVRQYSGPNASGTLVRTSSSVIDLCSASNVTVTTTYDEAPNNVVVGPGGQTITQGTTAQFVATAYGASGNIVLVPDNAFTWDVQGGVGTVSNVGLFTATTAGAGSVRAILASPTIVGTAQLTVSTSTVTTKKWTVLVYLNASNDLYSASDLNMNQMEEVAGNPDVRFVVQWKQSRDVFPGSSFDGVRRYLVKLDTTNAIVSDLIQANLRNGSGNPLDMGDPNTLKEFVEWGKANYPADRYCLVIWNHGNGWRRSIDDQPTRAFSYDDAYGTSIQMWELGTALSGQQFDILAWDCSLMQMIECAYEAKDIAEYVVGSEESPPAEGYPYNSVFAKFRDNPDDTTRNLTKAFVDGMISHPPYTNRKITQSSIETAKLPALATAVTNLGNALIANEGSLTTIIPTVRNTAQSYSPTSSRVYRDLMHICQLLESSVGIPAPVLTASQDVRTKLFDALAWENHNSQSQNSHGLSIDFSGAGTFVPSATDYGRLKFAQDTSWNEWLAIAP